MPKKNPKHTKSYQMRRLSDLLRYEGPSWEGQNKQEIIENYIFSKFTENLFPAKGEERKTWTPDLKTIYVDYLGLNNVPEKEQIETRISIFPTQRPIFEWFFKFIVLNEFSNLFTEQPDIPYLVDLSYSQNKGYSMELPILRELRRHTTDKLLGLERRRKKLHQVLKRHLALINDLWRQWFLFVIDTISNFAFSLHLPEEAVRLIKENTDLINQMDGAFR